VRPAQTLPQTPRPAAPHTQRAAPSAPPVYRPAPNGGVQRKPAQPPHFPRVIQRMEEKISVEAHNWSVLCSYSSVEKEVVKAFSQAGYYSEEQQIDAILTAMRAKGWDKSKIAHKLGNKNSGKRGGTEKDITNCKNDLIAWAEKNTLVVKKVKKGGRRAKYDDDDDNNNNNNNNNNAQEGKNN
jgi:hypothetical protein